MECEKCKERDLIELDYGYLEPELFSRDRLEILLTLEQFQKRWGIVKSHLILWDKYEELQRKANVALTQDWEWDES